MPKPITLFGAICLLLPTAAFAQAPVQPFGSGVIDSIAMFSTLAVTGLNLATWVVFYFLNILLSPSFIFDLRDATNNSSFMDMLNIIWMLSRDLVNIVFAFALVGVAVVTVVMAKKDFIAEHWRKFVLAIILVNFSWLFPRLILDVANISAATVYGVPSLISTGTCSTVMTAEMAASYPYGNCQAIPNSTMQKCDCFFISDLRLFLTPTERAFSMPNQGWSCPLDTIMCFQKQRLDPNSVAAHSAILNGLIVNHARLQVLAGLPPPTGNAPTIAQLMQFIMRELLVILFHVLLLFPLLALFIAFIVRIPVLWLTIAFMPFYFLGWVIPEKFTGGYTEQIMQYFLKAAFLPAIVGIPLTVGFIMVNAGTNLTHTAITQVIEDVTWNILPGITNMWEILWMLISMGVVWVGVFTVLESMGKLGMGSAAIKNFGGQLGRSALRLPAAIPFIPGLGAGGGKGSIQEIPGFIARKTGLPPELLGGGGFNRNEIQQAAQRLSRNDGVNTRTLNELTGKLNTIAGNIANGSMDRQSAARSINEMSRETGITVNTNNIESVLRDLKDGLTRNGRTDASVTNLDAGISRLAAALNAAPPPAAPAPAAPPAAPAP